MSSHGRRIASTGSANGAGSVEVSGRAVGKDRERRAVRCDGRPRQKKEVPTLKEFAPRFLDGHARANRQKPSGIAAKEVLLRVHLVPRLGPEALDAITNEDVQRLKRRLSTKAPKTVNNVLTVLSVLLKKAVEWDVIDRMPCTIRLLPVPKPSTAVSRFRRVRTTGRGAAAVDATAAR